MGAAFSGFLFGLGVVGVMVDGPIWINGLLMLAGSVGLAVALHAAVDKRQ